MGESKIKLASIISKAYYYLIETEQRTNMKRHELKSPLVNNLKILLRDFPHMVVKIDENLFAFTVVGHLSGENIYYVTPQAFQELQQYIDSDFKE